MGKTPKKAAPGGDERNLYNWRLKAPSNSSEPSLPKRQRVYEIPKRSKLSNLNKNIPPPQKKNLKYLPVRKRSKSPGISKEKKPTVPEKGIESKLTKTMHPDSEEPEAKIIAAEQKEEQKQDIPKDNEESAKDCVDNSPSKPAPKEQEDTVDKEPIVEEQTECNKEDNSNKSKENEECDNDLQLSLEPEESSIQILDEKSNDKDAKNEDKEECSLSSKNETAEKEDLQSESQTDTESCSVDVLESTTSEVSEVSETASQIDTQKEKEKSDKEETKETSFISYDPSIMLKDVQIKLNDCLKENPKLFDTSIVEHSTPSQSSEMSFGKTLRSISGRRSLNRMRYVTLREQRYSPNDSMFVNTSGIPVPPDDTSDFKILRYSTGLSDMMSSANGSPTERKRKHEHEHDWDSIKKPKTESEHSLLNSSIGLLKGLRRPIQVSTPVSELKFQSNKLDMTNDQNTNQTNEATKKWCAIM